MSHIVTIRTEIRDAAALTAACRRLSLPVPVRESVKLFSGEATGHAVRLPNWRYPVVCHLGSGQLEFDNYEGRWGDPTQLNSLRRAYAIEKATIESRKQGHTVAEQQLDDGSVKLTINVGGSA